MDTEGSNQLRQHPSASPTAPAKATATTTTTEGSASKPTRSRRGCFACRRRKVKCDEKPPTCRNCSIGNRDCHWPAEDEVHRNKKRRQSRPPSSDLHSGYTISDSFPEVIQSGLLSLADLPSPYTSNHSGPSSIKAIAQSPTYGSSTASITSTQPHPQQGSVWSFSQIPSVHTTPALAKHDQQGFKYPPVSKKKKEYMDAAEFSDILIAADRQAELMADAAFLQPYFPNMSDRLVMRHYLQHTVKVIMAYDSKSNPWNPWVSIHAAAAFRHEPGVSAGNDALRTAILAVGAVHMRYGHNRKDAVSAWQITHQARVRVLALVKQSNVWENHGTQKGDEDELELVLAALLSCTIASSLAADDKWHELLTTVLGLIERLGGAQQILQQGSHDRMSLRRFVIEQLATRDVFGCMTTDLAPSILNESFTPWFFEAERWSNKEREWESMERMFGMSRRLVEIIARVCSLVAKVRQYDYRISEEGDTRPTQESNNINLRLPARVAARLSNTPTVESPPADPLPSASTSTTNPSSQSEQHRLGVQRIANSLLDELKVWDSAYTFVPLHPRTQYGNHAYWHALRLRLLREVFRVRRDDKRIKDAVAAIMEISKEMLSLYGRIVWMTWPILIAGFNMAPNDPSRSAALEFLCEFEPHACFDNAAACRTLLEFWKYNDAGRDDTLPTEVFRKLQSRPFLD